jgi:hypothetical protein
MEYENRDSRKVDIAKDIIFFFVTTAIAFAYFMLVLLIISFVTISYIHFTIEGIFIMATVATVGVDIHYVVKKIRKYRKK